MRKTRPQLSYDHVRLELHGAMAADVASALLLFFRCDGNPVRTCPRLEYKEIAPLGSGNFSRVYKVRCRFDGMVYAAKRTARALRSDADKKRWQQVLAGTHVTAVWKRALWCPCS